MKEEPRKLKQGLVKLMHTCSLNPHEEESPSLHSPSATSAPAASPSLSPGDVDPSVAGTRLFGRSQIREAAQELVKSGVLRPKTCTGLTDAQDETLLKEACEKVTTMVFSDPHDDNVDELKETLLTCCKPYKTDSPIFDKPLFAKLYKHVENEATWKDSRGLRAPELPIGGQVLTSQFSTDKCTTNFPRIRESILECAVTMTRKCFHVSEEYEFDTSSDKALRHVWLQKYVKGEGTDGLEMHRDGGDFDIGFVIPLSCIATGKDNNHEVSAVQVEPSTSYSVLQNLHADSQQGHMYLHNAHLTHGRSALQDGESLVIIAGFLSLAQKDQHDNIKQRMEEAIDHIQSHAGLNEVIEWDHYSTHHTVKLASEFTDHSDGLLSDAVTIAGGALFWMAYFSTPWYAFKHFDERWRFQTTEGVHWRLRGLEKPRSDTAVLQYAEEPGVWHDVQEVERDVTLRRCRRNRKRIARYPTKAAINGIFKDRDISLPINVDIVTLRDLVCICEAIDMGPTPNMVDTLPKDWEEVFPYGDGVFCSTDDRDKCLILRSAVHALHGRDASFRKEATVGLMMYDIFDVATGDIVQNVGHGDINVVSFVDDIVKELENWTMEGVQRTNETVKESLKESLNSEKRSEYFDLRDYEQLDKITCADDGDCWAHVVMQSAYGLDATNDDYDACMKAFSRCVGRCMHEITSHKGSVETVFTVFTVGGDFHPLLGMLKATRMNGKKSGPVDGGCQGKWATDNDLCIASVLLDVGIVTVEVGTNVPCINTRTLLDDDSNARVYFGSPEQTKIVFMSREVDTSSTSRDTSHGAHYDLLVGRNPKSDTHRKVFKRDMGTTCAWWGDWRVDCKLKGSVTEELLSAEKTKYEMLWKAFVAVYDLRGEHGVELSPPLVMRLGDFQSEAERAWFTTEGYDECTFELDMVYTMNIILAARIASVGSTIFELLCAAACTIQTDDTKALHYVSRLRSKTCSPSECDDEAWSRAMSTWLEDGHVTDMFVEMMQPHGEKMHESLCKVFKSTNDKDKHLCSFLRSSRSCLAKGRWKPDEIENHMEHLLKVVKGVGPTVVAKTQQFLSDFRSRCVSAVDSRIGALHAMGDFYANKEEEMTAYANDNSYKGQKNKYCTWLQTNAKYQESRPGHALTSAAEREMMRNVSLSKSPRAVLGPVEIRKSTVCNGWGLFAVRDINPNEIITTYDGRITAAEPARESVDAIHAKRVPAKDQWILGFRYEDFDALSADVDRRRGGGQW